MFDGRVPPGDFAFIVSVFIAGAVAGSIVLAIVGSIVMFW